MNKNIQIKFFLSPLGYRAHKWIKDDTDFSLIIELFVDAYNKECYRDFSLRPIFPNPSFKVIGTRRLTHKDQINVCYRKIPLSLWRRLQPLMKKNLSLSWICEEALYFGWQKSILKEDKVKSFEPHELFLQSA